jgi:hypothetical protein
MKKKHVVLRINAIEHVGNKLIKNLKNTLSMCFQKTFWRADPFWLRNITTVPHILTDVNYRSGTLVSINKKLYLSTYFIHSN